MALWQQHVHQVLGDYTFVNKQLEDLMPEYLFQIFSVKGRCYLEHTVSIKTAVRDKNVKMRIES